MSAKQHRYRVEVIRVTPAAGLDLLLVQRLHDRAMAMGPFVRSVAFDVVHEPDFRMLTA